MWDGWGRGEKTRCYNKLNEALVSRVEKQVLLNKCGESKLAWEDLELKHDNYMIAKYHDQEDLEEEEDKWIDQFEEKFEIIQKAIHDYIDSLEKENKLYLELQVMEEKSNQSKEAVQAAIFHRNSVHLMFQREIKSLTENINLDSIGVLKSQVVSDMKDVKSHLEKCKEAHLIYISYRVSSSPEEENVWIENVQQEYDRCNRAMYSYLKMVSETELEEKRKLSTKMESIKMPSFGGNIREYANFKADFKMQVENRLDSVESQAYVLRSCFER